MEEQRASTRGWSASAMGTSSSTDEMANSKVCNFGLLIIGPSWWATGAPLGPPDLDRLRMKFWACEASSCVRLRQPARKGWIRRRFHRSEWSSSAADILGGQLEQTHFAELWLSADVVTDAWPWTSLQRAATLTLLRPAVCRKLNKVTQGNSNGDRMLYSR